MGKKKDDEIFSPRKYSEALRANYWIRYDKNNRLWVYTPEGIWMDNGEVIIEQILRTNLLKDDHIGSYHVREIIADLKSLSFRNRDFPTPAWHLIPFKNGVYDLNTGKFSDLTPQLNLQSKLAVNYNPNTKDCPVIDGIFNSLVPSGDVTDLYDLAGYCMVPTYANQEVYFLLGSGRNGKSTYTDILIKMLGSQNVSSVSLNNLQLNRFSGAELHGKFANISSELRYNDLSNTDLIKKLSGGDLVQAEKKFHNPFQFTNFAKLIFVTNELPRTIDKTGAFYRRVRLINFPYTFEGAKEDKLIRGKITTDELEGLAFKCIQCLDGIKGHNFTFRKQKSTKDISEEYEQISNPFDTFFNEHCEYNDNGFITKPDFKDKLNLWLRETGQRVRIDKDIAQYMREKGIDDQKRSLGGGDRKNSWVGIKWKE